MTDILFANETILCAVISLLFACLMCYLWVDAAKERDRYQPFYEYYPVSYTHLDVYKRQEYYQQMQEQKEGKE